jgi:hypothetical protein
VLFLLFPRMAPLWGMPQDAAGRTGLSGSLRMGGVAQIANDDSIAMRVRFFGRAPDPSELYFRGPVLGSFDGREWTPGAAQLSGRPAAAAEVQLLGAAVDYELTLEPSRLPLLPMLELTPDRPGAAPDLDGWTDAARRRAVAGRPAGDRAAARAGPRPGPRTATARAAMLGLRDWWHCRRASTRAALAWAAALRERPELAQADARRWRRRC